MSNEWSQWLDFDRTGIDAVPEKPGVCIMHANMKILFIGGNKNLRQELLNHLSNPCTSKAKRFKYILTDDFENVKNQQLKEYVDKHKTPPPCME